MTLCSSKRASCFLFLIFLCIISASFGIPFWFIYADFECIFLYSFFHSYSRYYHIYISIYILPNSVVGDEKILYIIEFILNDSSFNHVWIVFKVRSMIVPFHYPAPYDPLKFFRRNFIHCDSIKLFQRNVTQWRLS